MSEGRFIQAGLEPAPAGPSNDGYGQFLTVDALDQAQRERLRAKLEADHPELFARAARAMRAKHDALAACEGVRQELFAAVGAGHVTMAMQMALADGLLLPTESAPMPIAEPQARRGAKR